MRWLIVALAVMLLVSCSDDPKKPDPEPEPAQMQAGSWEDVLDLFEQVWEEKNFELYDSLLTEGFVFHFAQVDVEEDPDIPPSWNRSQDLDAVLHLFVDPNVEDIELTWVPGDLLDPETEGLDGRILVSNVILTIFVRDDEGVLWEIIIRGSVEFEFKKMSYTTSEGDTVWKIATWQDLTGAPPLVSQGRVANPTWGSMKYRARR